MARRAFRAGLPAALIVIFVSAAQADETQWPEIHGEYAATGAGHWTGGSGQRTLLHKGVFMTNELKLKLDQDLWDEWKVTGNIHLRKTPDPQIDDRSAVRLLGGTLELYNPVWRFTGGDFFGDLSQYTMLQALKGFQAAYKTERLEVKGVAAYSQRADEGEHYFRYVFGGKADVLAAEELGPVKNLHIGSNFSDVEDDSGSIDNRGTAPDISAHVGSVTTSLTLWETTEINAEAARSWADPDALRTGLGLDRKTDTAVRVSSYTRFDRDTKFRFGYEWVGADFETPAGSAAPDRVQFTTRLDRRLNREWGAEASYRSFYDKLEDSTLNQRTLTQAPRVALNWSPSSENWFLQDFTSTFYWEERARNSQDDPAGQRDFVTDEWGTDGDFRLWGLNFNSGWSIRNEDDDFSKENNRLINTGYLGFRTRQKVCNNIMATPSLRYQFDYEDLPKLEGRDLMQTVSAGLNLDVTEALKIEQRYSVSTANRLVHDSDTARFNAFAALDYKIPVKQDLTFRLSYEHTGLSHPSALNSYAEENLQSQLLWNF